MNGAGEGGYRSISGKAGTKKEQLPSTIQKATKLGSVGVGVKEMGRFIRRSGDAVQNARASKGDLGGKDLAEKHVRKMEEKDRRCNRQKDLKRGGKLRPNPTVPSVKGKEKRRRVVKINTRKRSINTRRRRPSISEGGGGGGVGRPPQRGSRL